MTRTDNTVPEGDTPPPCEWLDARGKPEFAPVVGMRTILRKPGRIAGNRKQGVGNGIGRITARYQHFRNRVGLFRGDVLQERISSERILEGLHRAGRRRTGSVDEQRDRGVGDASCGAAFRNLGSFTDRLGGFMATIWDRPRG
jgi:hypothetical protein